MITPSEAEGPAVAIFDSYSMAEEGISALQSAGFGMRQASVVARDFHTEEQALGVYTSGERIRFLGVRGLLWGRLWAILSGSGIFFVPTVGLLVVMGPFVELLAKEVEERESASSTGALARALGSFGVASDLISRCEAAIKLGQFLVVARGVHAALEAVQRMSVPAEPSVALLESDRSPASWQVDCEDATGAR